ncbi:leucine-rich repeat domain-containing protein [Chitinophaga sp. Cy-1792]|uniref:leucine-rich repeat domain-containing protein n=1 Tax=Chitinophaga sp. Cy-1792 TaxID=2608339 RepID=UPI00141FF336|nr:leucine-rich repeat domain-containing protein [Chitinophaga sp. Cy-1792]NIG55941.1 leucine-rich repeat domain-containing protein [Chitinophaga sp. Cy-1792]
MNISKFRMPRQNKQGAAWQKLCDYIDKVAAENGTEFSPADYLGRELFAEIQTLPATIAKLKTVEKIRLSGSNIKLIPPEIGQMTALKSFVPYPSEELKWLPYELTHCKALNYTHISIRAQYGNFKTRKPFPSLRDNPLRYDNEHVCCSVCRKEMTWEETDQFWINLQVGSHVMPLLANLCGESCKAQLPAGARGYVPILHKGGPELKQRGLGNPFDGPKAITKAMMDKWLDEYDRGLQLLNEKIAKEKV